MGLEQLLETSPADAVAYRERGETVALFIFPRWVDISALVSALRSRHGDRLFEVIDDARAGFNRLVVVFSKAPLPLVWYAVIENLRLTAEAQGALLGETFRNSESFRLEWVQDPVKT